MDQCGFFPCTHTRPDQIWSPFPQPTSWTLNHCRTQRLTWFKTMQASQECFLIPHPTRYGQHPKDFTTLFESFFSNKFAQSLHFLLSTGSASSHKFWYNVFAFKMLEPLWDWRPVNWLTSKGACYQAWWELFPTSCPLNSTYALWHVCTPET